MERFASGKGSASSHFGSGLDITGEELDRLWRFMALIIEFENLLFSAKRFLGRARCCLGERLGDGGVRIRTLYGAMHSKKSRMKESIDSNPYFIILFDAWNKWARDVVDMRNHANAKHHLPFGGRSAGYSIVKAEVEEIHFILPDPIPRKGESLPRR